MLIVDRGNLAFGLYEGATDLGQARGEVFRNLVLWRDRVAEEEVTARLHGGFTNSLGALHQFLSHHTPL